METRELICINCPLGCSLTVTLEEGTVKKVEGNPVRCVFLKMNDLIDSEGFETVDENIQEELPFK